MRWSKGLAVVLAVLRICGAISCYSCCSKNVTECKTISNNTNHELERVPVVFCKKGDIYGKAGCLKFVGRDNARKRSVVLRGCGKVPEKGTCDAMKKLAKMEGVEIKSCSICTTSLCNGAICEESPIPFLSILILLIPMKIYALYFG